MGLSAFPTYSSLRPALWAKALIVVSAVRINTPAVPQHSHKQISGRQSLGLAAPSVAGAGWLRTLKGRVTVVEEEEEECEQMLLPSSRSVWQWMGRKGTPGLTEPETAGLDHGSGMLPAAHRYCVTVWTASFRADAPCWLILVFGGPRWLHT